MSELKELVKQAVRQLEDIYDLNGGRVDITNNGDHTLLTLNNVSYSVYPTDDKSVDDIVSFIAADQKLQPKTIAKVEENNLQRIDKRKNAIINGEDDYGFDEYDLADDDDEFDLDICPSCGGHRFNSKLGLCIDCGYDEKAWGGEDNDDYGNDDDGSHDDDEDNYETYESLDTSNLSLAEDYPSLLVALDSEKDAEITYKTLIEIEESSDKPNQQVIDLLKKILADELEHIALLSALSASKNSNYVAEDSQEQFDGYVADMTTEGNK